MGFMNELNNINEYLSQKENIKYRIINNTLGKNLILLDGDKIETESTRKDLLSNFKNYIQEIIIIDEKSKDDFIVKEIKSICKENSYTHRNISYINWNREGRIESNFKNIIAGYSFKGGMGRSTTLAYLASFYTLMGKKIVVLDCDFEAPGISSLFFDKEIRKNKLGVIDYLIDRNIEDEPLLNNYYISEVFNTGGTLSLFPTGIDYDTNNYLNKISKIDFNSKNYMDNFQKLLNAINLKLSPDLIFIDLRAGINESNGFILKTLSNKNFLFFNSEEQNEDGLNVILNSLTTMKHNHIINSTIRYSTPKKELVELKENEFIEFMNKIKSNIDVLPIRYNESMLETNLLEFKKFVNNQYQLSKINDEVYLQNIINIVSDTYFINDIKVEKLEENRVVDIKSILEKLKKEFSKLIAKQKFKTEEDLKYFYFKDDILKLVNEQIFLVLGAKGTGKSTLFEIFTKNYKDVLNKLDIQNNTYIAGFSKDISNDIGKDYLKIILTKSNHKLEDIERFWKYLTLYQIEKYLQIDTEYFQNLTEIKDKFMDLEVGIEVDKRLKEINIELYKKDTFITLVYDELDVELTDKRENFIDGLVEFWRGNINKYSQFKSKVLLRNDIFNNLQIENKTHLDFNKYELKWSKDEILALILKIVITVLDEEELKSINLLDVVNKKNELIHDKDKIKSAIYKIFGKKLNETQSNISTMDNWIVTYLSDGEEVVTPRVIYKFLSESIKKELESLIVNDKYNTTILLSNFGKNYKDILYEVSHHKLMEYDEEYKGYSKYYSKIQKIGYRIFEYSEFKETYKKGTSAKTIQDDLKKLIDSGFIIFKDEKKGHYQVANVYVPELKIKMNRQGRRK